MYVHIVIVILLIIVVIIEVLGRRMKGCVSIMNHVVVHRRLQTCSPEGGSRCEDFPRANSGDEFERAFSRMSSFEASYYIMSCQV